MVSFSLCYYPWWVAMYLLGQQAEEVDHLVHPVRKVPTQVQAKKAQIRQVQEVLAPKKERVIPRKIKPINLATVQIPSQVIIRPNRQGPHGDVRCLWDGGCRIMVIRDLGMLAFLL